MKKETWSNKVGTINFAKYLNDLNNSVPDTRAIKICDWCKFRKAECEIIYTETKDYVCQHCKDKSEGLGNPYQEYLEALQLWNENKAVINEKR